MRGELERILGSPGFDASARNRRFLEYILEETLAGRADRLKGTSIAIDVFGRDGTIDPQHDPVVRIEAAKLRRRPERYYLTAGREDPIRIDIPKGGYVPTFERREPALPDPAAVAPAGERAAAVAAIPAHGNLRSRWPWLATGLLAGSLLGALGWFGADLLASRQWPGGSQDAATALPRLTERLEAAKSNATNSRVPSGSGPQRDLPARPGRSGSPADPWRVPRRRPRLRQDARPDRGLPRRLSACRARRRSEVLHRGLEGAARYRYGAKRCPRGLFSTSWSRIEPLPASALADSADSTSPDWLRRLRDARGCRREAARIYGLARSGGMDWQDANYASRILHTIYRMIEGSSFEARLEALEQAAAQDQPAGRPNGHHRPRHDARS